MSDAYHWIVEYRDGSTIAQIEPDGTDTGSWRKVDVRNVAKIILEPHDLRWPVHGVLVPDGATAFFTFRRPIEQNNTTGEQIKHPALVIAGWVKGDEEAYIFVDHQGNAVLASDRDALAMSLEG